MNCNLFTLIIICVCSFPYLICIHIEENAYKGISISFSEQITENNFKFSKLKEVLWQASKYLYHATRKRAYFQEFIFILPPSWTSDSFCSGLTDVSPNKVDVYVTNSTLSLKAQHSKGCGQEGDIIYMSPDWLEGDTEDLARQFVQQWSTYRYGVFEENPLEEGFCFASSEKHWSPVGCYNLKIQTKPEFSDEDGLAHCDPPTEIALRDIKSSLMYHSKSSKALDYCGGSEEYPHNPAMPTLHNNLCEGKSVWSIIENSNDFINTANMPSNLPSPNSPSFKCLHQKTLQLTLAIQISSSYNIALIVQEIRYTFYHFLKNLLPKKTVIHLQTFSNETNAENIILDLEDDKKLLDTLNEYVDTPDKVPSICLICGIQNALKLSQSTAHPSTVSVVVAFESAMKDLEISELTKVIQDYPKAKLHLILVKDTESDATTVELINALKISGGSLHFLPKPYSSLIMPNVLLNSQLNIVLSDVMKNPLQVDNSIFVVHEKIYVNQVFIEDTFVTPPTKDGKLFYFMHCGSRGWIKEHDSNCILLDGMSTTFKCGQVKELSDITFKTWTYNFTLRTGENNPTCISTALVYTSSFSDTISVKGWLNEHVIVPGQNALIIYAEVIGVSKQRILRVLAHISGPTSKNEFEIDLRDNGNGDPDVKIGDGIYSRYFTSFKEKGSYDVTVLVMLTASEETEISKYRAENSNKIITYKKMIGFFNVAAVPKTKIDVIPPNRVGDLKVTAIDHENSTVTFQWTAPGNNYDFGTATKYEIKTSSQPANLMELYFNTDVTTSLKSEKSPKSSGELESYSITFPKNIEDKSYYVALRAEDFSRNKGGISNIVQVYLKSPRTITSEPYGSSTISTASISTDSGNDFNITTSTEEEQTSSVSEVSSTQTNENISDISTDISWNDMLHSEKFIILVSSFGGILLLLVIINIIICCCLTRKRKTVKKDVSRQTSLRPPYNLNIAYQEESQSVHQSESGFSLTSLADQSIYSSSSAKADRRENSGYSYHTSKSLQHKSKLDNDSELGFRLVEALPAHKTRSLSRFARRLTEDDTELKNELPIAQPQKPTKVEGTQIYSLGIV